MLKKLYLTIVLLAFVMISNAESFQTLDTLKSETDSYLSSSPTVINLSTIESSDSVAVTIEETKYYFTPSGDEADLLKAVSGTPAGALVETTQADGLFYDSVSNKYYTFNVSSIPNSVFDVTDGSSSDYNFIVKEADSAGVLTDKYYKIAIRTAEMTSSPNISWEEVSGTGTGVVTVKLPNDESKYFKYTWENNDTSRGKYTTRQTSLSGDVKADFIGSSFSSSSDSRGGAIYNTTTIENIYGDFIGNYASSYDAYYSSSYSYGGAIDNRNTIGDITGDFIGNYTSSNNSSVKSSYSYGGAIYNRVTIGNITGDFIGNYATTTSSDSYSYGGAIYNGANSTIGNITGDFIGNYASSSSYSRGGGIYNEGGIGDITGDFIGNYTSSYDSSRPSDSYGGAISNYYSTIGNITGDFIGNYATSPTTNTYSSSSSRSYGGAIYNYGSTIGNITGDFIGNYASSSNSSSSDNSSSNSSGGAIYNYSDSTIGNITGNFIGNYASSNSSISSSHSSSSRSYGGAIFNGYNSTIGNIYGDFIGNYASSSSSSSFNSNSSSHSYGGAIYNGGTIDNITGDFIGNYVSSSNSSSSYVSSYSYGGAIYNDYDSTIGNIIGDFIGNYATSRGGAIYNDAISTIGNITGNFIGNYVSSSYSSSGGAIDNNHGTIEDIYSDFIGNYASSSSDSSGGAIYNYGSSAKLDNITGNFIGNYASSYNSAYGGAIYNSGSIDNITGDFIGNYAQTNSLNRFALGGAVYTTKDMLFSANGKDIEFTGNYTDDRRGKIYNAFYVYNGDTTNEKLTFNTTNKGSVTINDNISGGNASLSSLLYAYAYDIVLSGDGTGSVAFNAEVINAANVTVSDTVLTLGTYDHGDTTAVNNISNGAFWKTDTDKTTGFTNLTLNNATLNLDYNLALNGGDYQKLYLNDIDSSAGSNYLSFAANFGDDSQSNGYGLSDQIFTTTASGSINLKHINVSGDIAVGNKINLFGTTGMAIGNINDYTLIYGGESYTFKQENSNKDIVVAGEGALGGYIIYVPVTETLDFQNTDLDNVSNEGIIYNDDTTIVTGSDFTNNTNNGNAYSSAGNGGVLANGSAGDMSVIDSNFSNNTAKGVGGAIYGGNDLTLAATAGEDVTLANNVDKNGANDIYMEADTNLTLNVGKGSSININSGLNGDAGGYTLTVSGSDEGNVNINAAANNVDTLVINGGNLNASDPSDFDNVNLVLNGGVYGLEKNIIGDILVNNLTGNGGSIWLDVDPDTLTSDIIKVSGDIVGSVRLTLNALSTSQPTDRILFAETPNDDPLTDGGFSVHRVIGSPFDWTTEYDDVDQKWYLPIPTLSSNTGVTSEVMSYLGLHSASIEQTRSMVGSIKSKVASNKICVHNCGGLYDYAYDAKPLYNAWVNPIYFTSTVKDPVHIESDVYGLEAGFDVQQDIYNKLGVFASYRKGEYDLNGEGKHYRSSIKSEIDIDSYIGGLYYRYDRNNWWAFATVYGGVQKADLKTKDGVKSSTDGFQLGGSLEIGYNHSLDKEWSLEPSLGIYYTQIDFDNATDNYGKEARYDTIRHAEIEAGIKLEKSFLLRDAITKVYVKPSLVQNITDGDSVAITGLNKTNTYHDELMGRIELGGRYNLTDNLAGYGFINYTGASHYNAINFGTGLNYSW